MQMESNGDDTGPDPRDVPPLGTADAQMRALDATFDRFLALFNEATRRFGRLFPYNYLREAALRRIGRNAIAVTITSAHEGSVRVTCTVENGGLVRVPPGIPVGAAWEIRRETLEDAVARPWAYLAHPEHLAFGWFTARSRAGPPVDPLRD